MHIYRSATIPYTVESILALINDILAYPQFLPHCVRTRILSALPNNEVTAEMIFSKFGLEYNLITQNKTSITSNETRVELKLLSGPFKRLHGLWKLKPIEDRTLVEFELDFAFSNRLVELSFGTIFEHLATKIVDIFLERARTLYG